MFWETRSIGAGPRAVGAVFDCPFESEPETNDEEHHEGRVEGRGLIVAGLVLGLGVGLGRSARVEAQQKGPQHGTAARSSRDQGSDDSGGSVDKALQSYQSYREKSGKNVEQARQEIEKMVKELTELIDMKYQMAVSLASQRAELRGAGGRGAVAYGSAGIRPGQSQNAGAARPRTTITRPPRRKRPAASWNRSRTSFERDRPVRNHADQIASQLRASREQLRAQARAGKEDESKSDDDKSSDNKEKDKDKKAQGKANDSKETSARGNNTRPGNGQSR